MASSCVMVLAPNGRRQTVKCTPDTTIMQIIDEVCKKQGFDSAIYDIKHHNKILDTSTTLRFSGLPNNAQLELVPITRVRQDSEVTIAINLENGTRVMGSFQPDDNFKIIIMELCPNEMSNNPIIIYTRRELFGNALETVTLRSLGLTGGRAMVRLVHKDPEELKIQANISAPLPMKLVEEKPYHRIYKPVMVDNTVCPSETLNKSVEEVEKLGVRPVQKKQDIDFVKVAREKRKLNESIPPKTENARLKGLKIEDSPKKNAQVNETMDIDQVDGDNTMLEPNFIFLDARNAMLFSMESADSVPIDEELPDDFFELTLNDAKKILKDIRRKRIDIENQPLQTSALRELEESKKQLRKLNKYQKAIIRVIFPDRTVLQGTFTPNERIQDVINFVKEYLDDSFVELYLYTTPPKCILPEDNRLVELGCVPGALLHLGVQHGESKFRLKSAVRDKFTSNSMASLAASKLRREATRHTVENDVDVNEELMECNNFHDPGPSTSGLQQEFTEKKLIGNNATIEKEKLPKWFKPL